MVQYDPDEQRRFAIEVVERLREAGHTALWAGGCVRDRLLGLTPKDYDVATDARPEQVRALFGQRRTLAIGAAFGVITVIGRKHAGQIEVATFRRDLGYSDGRRPDAVAFSTPEEDARRRDFTINGLFFDPVTDEVLDFVGGQADLERRVVRAIGAARERFEEDKLRMLRAVRFAAKFDFRLDAEARDTIAAMAGQIGAVSPERIAAELRAMLTGPRPGLALRLLHDAGLLGAILPEWGETPSAADLNRAIATLDRLAERSFPLALAAALPDRVPATVAHEICRRLRLSNRESDRVDWLVAHRQALAGAGQRYWPTIQRLLTHSGAGDLIALGRASGDIALEDLEFCEGALARPRANWDPPPLVTGDDLARAGIPTGKHYQELLSRVRDAQLEGVVTTRDAALALAKEHWSKHPGET